MISRTDDLFSVVLALMGKGKDRSLSSKVGRDVLGRRCDLEQDRESLEYGRYMAGDFRFF